MKKRLTYILIVLSSSLLSTAQSFELLNPIDSILLKDAHTVKRFEKSELVVLDLDKATFKTRQVYTVLDKQGNDALSFWEYSDKFRKLDEFKMTVYNRIGLPEKTFIKKDLEQNASNNGLVEDGIYYHLKLAPSSYPFTIEISYTIKYKGILNYPSFDIQGPEESVKYAQYTASIPKQYGLRYSNQETNIQPVITEDAVNINYTWEVKNLAAIRDDEGSVSWESRFPRVIIAPNKFKLDDYAGDMTTWQSFGNWYATLASKSSDLSDDTKKYLRSLVSNTSDTAEKARILYEYLQSNFRYVSIQLGIGGFKPFPASFTDAKKYGDCKALSNYMQACLAAVNIKSYQALINAGNNKAPVNPVFPVNAFNHDILCIPMEKDSLWLECTSSYNDFGKLGNFTENRNALLITENGGALVATPVSKSHDNKFLSKETIHLNEDGTGTVQANFSTSGEYKSEFINLLYNESNDDQKNALLSILDLPVPESFELSLSDDTKKPMLETRVDLSFDKVPAFTAGPKMFLNRHLFKLWTKSLPAAESRTKDFYFSHPLEKNDTTIYHLPEGYTVESMPVATNIIFKYGGYHSNTWQDQTSGDIISVSSAILRRHIIPAADFMETRKFCSQMIEDELQKIVIRKK